MSGRPLNTAWMVFALAFWGHVLRVAAASPEVWSVPPSPLLVPPKGVTNAIQIATGPDHCVVLRADGRAVAWGDNTYGAVGIDTTMRGIRSVAAGLHSTLVVRSNGTIVGWGSFPQPPAGLTGVASIACGYSHFLALRTNGTVVGWAASDDVAGMSAAAVPTGLTAVVQLAAGHEHSLALLSSGKVVEWGPGAWGTNSPPPPSDLNDAIAVAAGTSYDVALRRNGTLVIWGASPWETPRFPAGLPAAVAVTAAGSVFAALLTDGRVVACADGSSAAVTPPIVMSNVVALAGSESHLAALTEAPFPLRVALQPADVSTPLGMNAQFDTLVLGEQPVGFGWEHDGRVVVPLGEGSASLRFASVEPSDNGLYTLVITNATHGLPGVRSQPARLQVLPPVGPQITQQPTNQSLVPGMPAAFEAAVAGSPPIHLQWLHSNTNLPGATGFQLLLPRVGWEHAGRYQLMASNAYGSVLSDVVTLAVADDSQPTLGTRLVATELSPFFPQRVLQEASNAVDVSLGARHGVVLRSDNTAIAWVISEPDGTNLPVKVRSLAKGSSVNAVVTTAGDVFGWTPPGYAAFYSPPDLKNVIALAGGNNYFLALTGDGHVRGWGDSYSQSAYLAPLTLTNAVAIAASMLHSLALRSDGTVICWGSNDALESTPPTNLIQVVAIAAGFRHSLALRQDGTVICWGENLYGQCSPPSGLRRAVAIAADASSSHALLEDGTVASWGSSSRPWEGSSGPSNVVAISADQLVAGIQSVPMPLRILAHPVAVTGIAGDDLTVGVRAVGTPPFHYEWRRNGVPLDPAIGASPLLVLSNATPDDQSLYTVRVTDRIHPDPGVLSTGIVVRVLKQAAPVVRRLPRDTIAAVGGEAVFDVDAAGGPPPAYQWLRNGAPINGATSSVLRLMGITLAQAGNYSVVLSNTLGVTSTPAVELSVTPEFPARVAGLSLAESDGLVRVQTSTSDTAGNTWVTGQLQGPARFGRVMMHDGGQGGVFVAQCDAHGDWRWATRASVEGAIDIRAIAASREGTVAVSGMVYQGAFFDGVSVGPIKDNDLFTAFYNPTGDLVRVQPLGSATGVATTFGTAYDTAGILHLAVWQAGLKHLRYTPTGQALGPTPLPANLNNAWADRLVPAGQSAIAFHAHFYSGTLPSQDVVATMTTSGNVTWQAPCYGWPQSLAADSHGNLYAAGHLFSTGTVAGITLDSQGQTDGFLARYSSVGTLQWARSLSPTYRAAFDAVASDADGNAYVAGTVFGEARLGGVKFSSPDQQQVFVARLDTTGNVRWLQMLPDGDIRGLGVDTSGNLHLTLNVTGEARFEDQVVAGSSQGTLCIVHLAPQDGVPSIVEQPADQRVVAGDRVTLHVGTGGAQPLTFQWFKDGHVLPGSDAGSLLLDSSRASIGGAYSVVVSNRVGTTRSRDAQVTPVYPVTVHFTGNGRVSGVPSDGVAPEGSSVSLVAIPSPGEEFLGWAGDFPSVQNPISFTANRPVELTAQFSDRTPLIFVTSPADSGVGTLRHAIHMANARGGGEIRFRGIEGTLVLQSPLPAVLWDLDMVGPGTNQLGISGVLEAPALTVASQAVCHISGIRFENLGSQLPVNGRAISNSGTLLISSCLFSGNRTTGDGGGIYSTGNLRIENSCFVNNQAGRGGALVMDGGRGEVLNSAFLINQALGSNSVPKPTPTQGYYTTGQAGEGGAIVLQQGELALQRCRFDWNGATGGTYDGPARGGAIQVVDSSLSVSESLIEHNKTQAGETASLTPARLGANGAESSGGGLALQNANAVVVKTTFSANGVLGAAGSTESLSGGNAGKAAGGGIHVDGGTLTLHNSTLSGNRVEAKNTGSWALESSLTVGGPAYGAGIAVTTGSVYLVHSTVTANQAIGGAGTPDPRLWPNSPFQGSGLGGGLARLAGDVTVTDSIIAGNTAGPSTNSLPDIAGTLLSGGFNLIGITNGATGFVDTDLLGRVPDLGPLADHGGPTPTHALLPRSAAINAADDTGLPDSETDQRGFPRPVSGRPDIGAYEFGSGTAVMDWGSGGGRLVLGLEPLLSYTLLASTNLLDWAPLLQVQGPTNRWLTVEDPADLPAHFYKLALP